MSKEHVVRFSIAMLVFVVLFCGAYLMTSREIRLVGRKASPPSTAYATSSASHITGVLAERQEAQVPMLTDESTISSTKDGSSKMISSEGNLSSASVQTVSFENGNKTPPVTARMPLDTQQTDLSDPIDLLHNTVGDVASRNEAANSLRRAGYKGLSRDLIAVLNNPKEKPLFRSWCIQHLYNNLGTADEADKQLIVETFRTSVVDRDIPVQREAVLALVRMGDPLGKETAVKWLLDENVNGVHDIAIRCVHMLDLKDQIPAVRKYLDDSDEIVRIAAIVALSEWGDEESRPAFERQLLILFKPVLAVITFFVVLVNFTRVEFAHKYADLVCAISIADQLNTYVSCFPIGVLVFIEVVVVLYWIMPMLGEPSNV